MEVKSSICKKDIPFGGSEIAEYDYLSKVISKIDSELIIQR